MKISYFDLALLFCGARFGDSACSLEIRDRLLDFDNMLPQLIRTHSALRSLRKAGLVSAQRGGHDHHYFRFTEAGRVVLAF